MKRLNSNKRGAMTIFLAIILSALILGEQNQAFTVFGIGALIMKIVTNRFSDFRRICIGIQYIAVLTTKDSFT